MSKRRVKLSAIQQIADLCARSDESNSSDVSDNDHDDYPPCQRPRLTPSGDQSSDDEFYPNPGVYNQPSDGEVEIEDETESSDESEASEDECGTSDDNSDVCTSPNGICWSKTPIPVRRLRRNILNFNEGPTIRPLDELASFFLFFTEVILRTIMRFTNRRMRAKKEMPFSFAEMKAAIAVIIRAGADKENLSDLDDLFRRTDSKPFYRCAISKNRMRKFMQNVTLDEKQTRQARQKEDKLAAVREIWDQFALGLRKYYVPSSSLTVDEQLYGFRGYVPGRCYMPMKPSKYGIKIFWLCDAKNGFALEPFLYSGKEEGRSVGLAEHVVMKLVSFYSHSWRNIFMDRFFTSYALCKNLLNNGLTMTGTMISSRRDVPQQMRVVRGREKFSTESLYEHENKIVLISYVPKRNKNVILMSSMHQNCVISRRPDYKPDIILDYNSGKGGVDLMDSRIADFTCKRMTRRYPLVFFFNVLDISLLNSFLIMQMNDYQKTRKHFIKTVSDKLASENIELRCNNPKIFSKSKDAFASFGVNREVRIICQPNSQGPRKCQIGVCRTSTRHRCFRCNRPICNDHKLSTCTDCVL